ncbi:hypothetical protein PVAND_010009 [Polypedilum vanderplanki]|uniref:Uncharacterized protein n=1 Tax=Polypedilum vanderplanki TaxID=319348 RepID=A0A9J6CFW0_POLVA|nr:hypothetical protein PVAND_010009 [Polypedilum vanderplanki]
MSKLLFILVASTALFYNVLAGGPHFIETSIVLNYDYTSPNSIPSILPAPICGTLPYKPCSTFECPKEYPHKKTLGPKYGCCCSNNTLLWG